MPTGDADSGSVASSVTSITASVIHGWIGPLAGVRLNIHGRSGASNSIVARKFGSASTSPFTGVQRITCRDGMPMMSPGVIIGTWRVIAALPETVTVTSVVAFWSAKNPRWIIDANVNCAPAIS